MADPYITLGVGRSATEEEIKNAYRALAEKYSADNYAGNPLADLAANKIQEINDAYDQIMAERRTGGNTANAGERYSSPNYAGHSTPDYVTIRNLINGNRIDEAESRLLQINQNLRQAEWNFLMGSVCYAKGWLDEADRYYSLAASMEPNNKEYNAAYNRLRNNRRGQAPGNPYGGYNTSRRTGGCSGCDVCTGLICADCCCECMGGDLIRCC